MKKALLAISLVIALFGIHSCMESGDRLQKYEAYLNGPGAVEGFVKGFKSGAEGDIATPILDAMQTNAQLQQLRDERSSNWKSAWVWVGITAVIAFFGTKKKAS